MTKNIYEFSCEDSSGQTIDLSDFKGKTLLIVNTASQCGFTPQYEGLEKLQNNYSSEVFSVLAFPCNQFGGQEPGTNKQITEFCSLNYGNTFPIFSKIDVNGENAHPLFNFLTSEKKGLLGTQKIKWNFTKFLINKDGEPVNRYGSSTTPEQIQSDIEKLINP
jgi:glutathione peroxidase